jgi:hypothetical protein
MRRILRSGEVYGAKRGRTWIISKDSIDDYLFEDRVAAETIVGDLINKEED